MVKEKNINIHIHNAPVEKKKKRRRRKGKGKGKGTKSKYGISNPVQGISQSYFNPAAVAAAQASITAQREAQEYSHSYISKPKPKQNLLLDNGDDDQHGDRQKLLLGDAIPTTKKEATKTFNTSFKNYKPKPVEYTFERLSKVRLLKDLRSLMKDAKPDITEEQLSKINNKNKDAAIKVFLSELNKTSSISPEKKKEETEIPKMESHDAHTKPEFIDQKVTTAPIIEPPAAKTVIEPPAAKTEIEPPAPKGKPIFSKPAEKQTGRFTQAKVKELYNKQQIKLLEEYGINPEPFKLLSYTNQLKYLYKIMNGDKLPHEYELIENPETPAEKWVSTEYNSEKLKNLNDESFPVTPGKSKKHKKDKSVDALIPIIKQYDPPTVNVSEYLGGSSADPKKYFNTDD